MFATKLEWEIYQEQNRLRTNPKSFIPYLRGRLGNFSGKALFLESTDETLLTTEGAPAVREAIAYV